MKIDILLNEPEMKNRFAYKKTYRKFNILFTHYYLCRGSMSINTVPQYLNYKCVESEFVAQLKSFVARR